jgi:hypothetical protein
LEIREAGGIIFGRDVQIFGIHHGLGSDLKFGELGNLDIDIISARPGAALKKLKTLHLAKWWPKGEISTLKRELPGLKL